MGGCPFVLCVLRPVTSGKGQLCGVGGLKEVKDFCLLSPHATPPPHSLWEVSRNQHDQGAPLPTLPIAPGQSRVRAEILG